MQCILTQPLLFISDRYSFLFLLSIYISEKSIKHQQIQETIIDMYRLNDLQARAIDELAKRVFHVLENEPENFEPEFAGTRRRSARRAQIESKDCRLSADFNKPAKLTTTTYPKYTLSSAAATSMPEKNSRGSVKPATVASPTNTRNNCKLLSVQIQK